MNTICVQRSYLLTVVLGAAAVSEWNLNRMVVDCPHVGLRSQSPRLGWGLPCWQLLHLISTANLTVAHTPRHPCSILQGRRTYHSDLCPLGVDKHAGVQSKTALHMTKSQHLLLGLELSKNWKAPAFRHQRNAQPCIKSPPVIA